jgi:hypothetical protein
MPLAKDVNGHLQSGFAADPAKSSMTSLVPNADLDLDVTGWDAIRFKATSGATYTPAAVRVKLNGQAAATYVTGDEYALHKGITSILFTNPLAVNILLCVEGS